ncbi:uncharacterized protein BT62DRAFT_992354 [Guyanagaster necrorhizus]|uniref:RING-type domain-containing protein n=1 Tax=Guyanagaster necrorhizus TaxID=856835 RepID=A0A9P8AVH2_9AGAR|nr:uncharacterized protein BT62DRAFT_992354 [Guyanagaster necrorhizus MCA 3950]KAG7449315.1 hypothetical protein BT62DRAFT_992354 [Guyanagaster necrorhizus MCA 3950]
MDHHHCQRVGQLIQSLVVLEKHTVPLQDSCPICLIPFSDFFDDGDNLAPDCGVTKLDGCGHIFCRKDLTEWIRTLHGSCPTCRHIFLDIRPPSESDDESSDGGEYIPNDDEDDEAFYGEVEYEDFIEVDEDLIDIDPDDYSPVDEMDLDMYRTWQMQERDDFEGEWGLTDAESDSPSEGDMSWNESDRDNSMAGEDNVAVNEAGNEADDATSNLTRDVEDEPK